MTRRATAPESSGGGSSGLARGTTPASGYPPACDLGTRGSRALRALRSIAAGACLLSSSALAQSDGVSLFTTDAGTPAAISAGVAAEPGAAMRRDRIGRVDTEYLGALRNEVAAGRSGKLRVNLFRDVEHQASIQRSTSTASGYTLSGPLDDVPFGRVVLVVNNGRTMGRVYTPQGNWSIRTTGAMQTVEPLAPTPLRCGLEAEPPEDEMAARETPERQVLHFDGGSDALRRRRNPSAGATPAVRGTRLVSPPGLGRPSNADAGVPKARFAPPVASSDAVVASDDGDVVDVLVVYPSVVRDIQGGHGRMLSLIDLDIATVNEAYATSGVKLRVELAAAVEVEYDWHLTRGALDWYYTTIYLDDVWIPVLDHLTGKDDGYLDEVHALRDRYAADLVLLHLGDETPRKVARMPIWGIAHGLPEVTGAALEERGFSVATSGDGTVVAHELGHSMGLWHDRHDHWGNEPFPYSHGFRYEHDYTYNVEGDTARVRYGTIMATQTNAIYNGFVLAFSNPDLVHPGDPNLTLGVPGDEPSSAVDGPANAARHLNELRGVLANVRSRADADPCRYELTGGGGQELTGRRGVGGGHELTGGGGQVPAGGGSYRVRIDTQPDCSWAVNTSESVSSVSDPEGTGSAEISYTVTANEGWRRSVEVLVAGRLLVRDQAGSRPITPVCERSAGIMTALKEVHPDSAFVNDNGFLDHRDCTELDFGPDYLASVRRLEYLYGGNRGHPRDVRANTLGDELRTGDFDGLTGLSELWVTDIERVPPGLFSGLTGLRILTLESEYYLYPVELREIAPGAFDGMPGLRVVSIHNSGLRRLEAGTFQGLPKLLRLDFTRSREELTLEPGVFDGLSSLLAMQIGNHIGFNAGLTGLETGLFKDLGQLRMLWLEQQNSLRTLSVGAFDGLSQLRHLRLSESGLAELPAGVFGATPQLRNLVIDDNRLTDLHDDVFDPLPNLDFLTLSGNRLAALPSGLFKNLGALDELNLSRNPLGSLTAATFAGLRNLRGLVLANIGLRRIPPGTFDEVQAVRVLLLPGNRLGALEAGAFRGLKLSALDLWNSGVTSLEAGVFEGQDQMRRLYLADNRIRKLGPGALRGVRRHTLFLMHDNPGTPFTFAPTPYAVLAETTAPGEPVEIAVRIASAAPFWVGVSLAANGGSLSRRETTVYAGEVNNHDPWRPITVTPDGDGPTTVRIDGLPYLFSDYSCRYGEMFALNATGCYRGVRLAAGPPLVLFGIADRSFVRGRGAETVDLVSVFSYFLGAADYEVSTSDQSIAAVQVEDGKLSVTPGATGTAQVVVTATGAGGETLTRRFTVTVRVPAVPLFLSASNPAREGFVRVLNHSDKAGTVGITAIDDAGTWHGPVRLRLRPYGAAQFNSTDLQEGNEAKRLLEGVGVGFVDGDWRLEFESDLDIEALSYVRTEDGFLTPIHDAAPFEDGVHRIATFNPASNVRQVSRLRVINPGREAAEVTVRGTDDTGASPGGPVRFSVPAGAAREFDAMQLEAGAADLDGALGDGEGKWRLAVESDAPVATMSLLENTSTGHLTNLSSAPARPGEDGIHHVALFPAAGDSRNRQGFARVINHSQEAGTVRIAAFDDSGVSFGPLELSVDAGAVAHFNSDDLELGASGKGLSGGTGTGEGDWRLELSSDLDIEVLAYVRTEDGFLTAMHDTVAVRDGRRAVVLLNPGSNASQISRLRLANPLAEDTWVTIHGTDDLGNSPTDQFAYVGIPAGAALTLTAGELEAGLPYPDFDGYWGYWDREPLGDGRGKWRLSVVAEPGVLVQSLLESPTGHLTNLSSAPRMGAH